MPPVLWKLVVLALIVGICSGGHTRVQAQPSADEAPESTAPSLLEESPFLTEPKTADEFLETAVLSLRLARPQLARRYVEGLMALEPDDNTLLQLRDKHGPAVFLRLANSRELQPLSTQLLDRVNAAFRKRGADPNRIDLILQDLAGTAQQRDVSIVTLRSAGPVVVPRILNLIANPKAGIDQDLLTDALIRMGNPVIPPLVAALDSPNDNLRATVIQVLGYLGDRGTADHLWYPAFGPNQPAGTQVAARQALQRIFRATPASVEKTNGFGVTRELKRLAMEHYQLRHEWPLEDDQQVEYWYWESEAGTVTTRRLPPEAASLIEGARFARQALGMSPEDDQIHAMFIALALSSDAYLAGWDQPLPTGPGTAHDLALTSGADVVSAALALTLDTGNARGSIAALQVLAQVSTRHQLTKTDSKQAPIITALNYPDQRVQFAAAMTVLQLDPEQSFRNADRVVSILARALNTSEVRHVLVVHPNIQKAGTTAGLFGELGYQPTTAQTGRDAFRIAAEEGDIELIVVDANVVRWELSQTVANLRADARTAGIPIVISGPESTRAGVQGLLRRYPRTAYLIDSMTSENILLQLRDFLKASNAPVLSAEARAAQASAAAYWLAFIGTSQRSRIFPLTNAENALIRASEDPALADNVLRSLGAIGSKAAQEQLQSVALGVQVTPETREIAATQLALHIQRFGLLLSLEQVSALETAWRESNEPGVSTALAAVVGSLKPNAQRVSGRLQKFQAPPPIMTTTPPTPTPMP